MRNRKTPKIWIIIAVILFCSLMFMFLIFETDTIYDIDISGYDNVENNLRLPISVEEVIRKTEVANSGDYELEEGVLPPGVNDPNAPSNGAYIPSPPPAPSGGSVEDDIVKGLYTREDLDYMVALAGEDSTYEGFYAVACCVRNRCKQQGKTVKEVVTAKNQFTGFKTSDIGNYSNTNVYNAAVEVLRGGKSTIGDYVFFLGRSGKYDVWYEANRCGSTIPIVVGSGPYRNVYFKSWGDVHNKQPNMTSDAVVLYKHGSGWLR